MLKTVLAVCGLLLATGCGSGAGGAVTPAKTVTVSVTPSVSWDLLGRRACASAVKGEDLTAEVDAKGSAMPELNGLGDFVRIRAWCVEHYHG